MLLNSGDNSSGVSCMGHAGGGRAFMEVCGCSGWAVMQLGTEERGNPVWLFDGAIDE
jgi:hypothetical protein